MTQDCYPNCVETSRKTFSMSPLKLSSDHSFLFHGQHPQTLSDSNHLTGSYAHLSPRLWPRPHPNLTVFLFPWAFYISMKALFSRYDLCRSFLTFLQFMWSSAFENMAILYKHFSLLKSHLETSSSCHTCVLHLGFTGLSIWLLLLWVNSSRQPSPTHPCVVSTTLVTNPKHSTIWATGKKINYIPGKIRTFFSPYHPHPAQTYYLIPMAPGWWDLKGTWD